MPNIRVAIRTRVFLERDFRRAKEHGRDEPLLCLDMGKIDGSDSQWCSISSLDYLTDDNYQKEVDALMQRNPAKARQDHEVLQYNFCHWTWGPQIPDFDTEHENWADQVKVFQDLGEPMMPKLWDGFNVTLFAYGQTGSGKSYTMMGNLDSESQWGLIPRMSRALFEQLDGIKQRHESEEGVESCTIIVECQYLEIYNERVRDLLCLDRDLSVYRSGGFNLDQVSAVLRDGGAASFVDQQKRLRDEHNAAALGGKGAKMEREREIYRILNDTSSANPDDLKITSMKDMHGNTNPVIQGITRVMVSSSDDIFRLIEIGDGLRFKRATQMNPESSRSHSIFTITIKQFVRKTQVVKNKKKTTTDKIESNLNLVDLAGSERSQDTGCSGAGLAEGNAINRSLSALGAYIQYLAGIKGARKPAARDSRLTHLLQNSLGGNSLTTLIAALGPEVRDFDETKSTLRFANVAGSVKTKAVANRNPLEVEIDNLKKQLEAKEHELELLRQAADPDAVRAMQEELARAQAQLEQFKMISDTGADTLKATGAEQASAFIATNAEAKRESGPISVDHACILNVNSDPAWHGATRASITPAAPLLIGSEEDRATAEPDTYIGITGVGINPDHVTLITDDNAPGGVSMTVSGQVHLNGRVVEVGNTVPLSDLDTIIIADRYIYRFCSSGKQGVEIRDLISDSAYNDALDQIRADEIARMREKFEEQRRQMEEELAAMKQSEAAKFNKEQQEAAERVQELKDSGQLDEVAALEAEMAAAKSAHDAEVALQERLKRALMHKEQETRARLETTLSEVIPKVNQANAMLAQLQPLTHENVGFRPVILASYDPEASEVVSQVYIKVEDGSGEEVGELLVDAFTSKFAAIQAMWNYWSKKGELPEVDEEDSPFVGLTNPFKDHLIGTGQLISLYSSAGDPEDELQLNIINPAGIEAGLLQVRMYPVTSEDGEPFPDCLPPENYPEVGQEIHTCVEVVGAEGLPYDLCYAPFIRCQWYMKNTFQTEVDIKVKDTSPTFNFKHIFSFMCTQDFQRFINEQSIVFQVFGHPAEYVSAAEAVEAKRRAALEAEERLAQEFTPTVISSADGKADIHSDGDEVRQPVPATPQVAASSNPTKTQEQLDIEAQNEELRKRLAKMEEDMRTQRAANSKCCSLQ